MTPPPFKKGDWIQKSPDAPPRLLEDLHEARMDPVPDSGCFSGWAYLAFWDGDMEMVCASHFKKMTPDDKRKAAHRLRNEAQQKIGQAEALERAAGEMEGKDE